MSLQSCLDLIESVSGTKALFIGESIIDEYRFVSPLAKPSKENILAVRLVGTETYHGGVDAAIAHARDFCDARHLGFGNRILKARYLDDSGKKLFEVQEVDDAPRITWPHVDAGVAVVVTDFGHGAVPDGFVRYLCSSAVSYLAVAAQTNAANAGFNLVTKYPRADYIVIDEPEARLAAADRISPIEDVIRKLATGRCSKFVVTHGKHGAYGLDPRTDEVIHCDAMSDRVVDTMGAGDAFFAVTSPMARTGSMEDLLRIGNAAGALKTQILGHREPVTKTALIEFLRTAQWN